jgi:hypothetical protein
MSQILVSLISIAVVGFIVLRSGRDTRVEGIAWVRGTMIAALIPLGLQAAVLALFGLGEMLSGDLSGAGHLLSLLTTVLTAFLAWTRPLEGGIALVVMGLVAATGYRDLTSIGIMSAPQLVSGLLFLTAAVGARRSRHMNNDRTGGSRE